MQGFIDVVRQGRDESLTEATVLKVKSQRKGELGVRGRAGGKARLPAFWHGFAWDFAGRRDRL